MFQQCTIVFPLLCIPSVMTILCIYSLRKGFSLANMLEAAVEEVKKLLLVHPSIVIASKATIFGDRSSDMVRR